MNDTENPEEGNEDGNEEGNESVDLGEAWKRFQSEKKQAANAPEEVAAATELAKECARAVADGGSEASADSLLKKSSDSVGTRKSMLQDIYEEELEELKEDDDIYKLDELLIKKLDRLVVSRITDKNSETTYQWYFSDPDAILETSGEHRDSTLLRNKYFDEAGEVAKAPSDGAKPWYEWINQFISKQLSNDEGIAEVQKTTGERTLAVNDIQQLLQSLEATTDLEDAVSYNLLYLKEEDADTILVENSIIERVLSDHDAVNFRALNAEMDARGNLKGTAKQTSTSSISNITMWRIDRDWVEEVGKVEIVDSDELVMTP